MSTLGITRRGILRSRSARCSPTRSPKSKKNVRFVDCVDLEQAEYALASTSTADHRELSSTKLTSYIYNPATPELHLEKQFWLPSHDELQWLVFSQSVQLESVRWFGRAITGVIRVANIQYDKRVSVKYTIDNWATSQWTAAAFSGSPLPSQDQFSFCIFLPFLSQEMRVSFCVRYECGGRTFWDSNGSANYNFVCRMNASNASNPFLGTDYSIFF